jgi:hypothetical protein
MALETHLGKDGLTPSCRPIRRRIALRLATRRDLTDLLEQCTGEDLTALMVDYLDTDMN